MAHLKSLTGFKLLRKYVVNWSSVLAVYGGLKKHTEAHFKDGQIIRLSKNDYHEFYETLYRKYCEEHGFKYSVNDNGQTEVILPNKNKLILINVVMIVTLIY